MLTPDRLVGWVQETEMSATDAFIDQEDEAHQLAIAKAAGKHQGGCTK